MPYDFEMQGDNLVVRGVEVMTTLAKSDRPELKEDIDTAWLKKAIKTFEDDKKEGKRPQLLRRHNTKNTPAEVIGRLDNLRMQDGWLVADILVTNPDAIDKLKRGEMPSRSAEFSPGRNFLKGLSLIEGQEGHFDSRLPELVLQELVLLHTTEDGLQVQMNRPITQEQTNMLTTEDLAQLKSLIAETVDERLNKLLDDGAAADDLPSDDPESEVTKAVAGIQADADEKLAAQFRTNKIDSYVVALRSKGTIYTDNQLRQIFAKYTTMEGIDATALRLSYMKDTEIKLEIETDHETPKIEDELKAEYAQYMKNYPDSKTTELDYIELCTGKRSLHLTGPANSFTDADVATA